MPVHGEPDRRLGATEASADRARPSVSGGSALRRAAMWSSSARPPPSSRDASPLARPVARDTAAMLRPTAPAAHPSAQDSSLAAQQGDGQTLSASQAAGDLSPRKWDDFFERSRDVALSDNAGTFRCYFAGSESASTAVVFLHGAGQGALSWGCGVHAMRKSGRAADGVQYMAYDARGHGSTTAQPEKDFSTERMVADALALIELVYAEQGCVDSIFLVGHSMGGAMAARAANSGALKRRLRGLVVIDVVEGTALSALPRMHAFLERRPKSFKSTESAVAYTLDSAQVLNPESARLSVPAQLQHVEERMRYEWRTDLEATERYWEEWFRGMSQAFLSAQGMKLLILNGIDRLDRELTIAQMQGKFQQLLLPTAGHCIHEDEPTRVATTLEDFVQRASAVIPAVRRP